MKIVVISPTVPKDVRRVINIEDKTIYACDNAVRELLRQNIKIDLAIGDFDSLENKSLLSGIKTIKLSVDKDESDTAYALRHAYQHTDEVILVGGIKGSRSDHFIGNLLLLEKYPNLTILDDTNKIIRLETGIYQITSDNFKYISLFPLLDSVVSIYGTKYELESEELFQYDTLGLSNEIIKSKAILEIHQGVLLVIQSSN
jgi:thiamine pyrophosphokinase